MNGMVRLRLGDVVRVLGTHMIVDMVNESRARCVPLRKVTRTITPLVGEPKTFTEVGKPESISCHIEPGEILERRGQQGLQDFLSSKKAAGRQGDNNNAAGKENMPKKEKKQEAPSGVEGARGAGKLGSIMGFSTTSVLRRLGMSTKITVAHARAIMKAQKVDVSDTTVSIQLNNGRNGKGVPAPISKEQLDELVKSAPAPAEEPKATTKPKAKAKGKAKGKKGGKEVTAKTEAAPAPTAAATAAAA